MTPKQIKRVIELTAELEELLKGHATFLYGDSPDDLIGILVADSDTSATVMGDNRRKDNVN